MRDELFELPYGWEWVKISDIASYVTSGSRDWSKYYSDSGAIFIRTQDINTNTLCLDNAAYVALPEKVEGKRSLVEQDDILITITGANVGKCAIVLDKIPESYVSQSVALIKLKSKNLARFVHLACLAPQGNGSTKLREMAYGLGRPVLSLGQIHSLEIPLPPLNEQNRIIAKIEELRDRHQRAKQALEAVPELCDRFRQSVLAAAFRGDLTADWREENPDVETALDLLDKIRRDRYQQWEQAELDRIKAENKFPKNDDWKKKYPELDLVHEDVEISLPDSWVLLPLSSITNVLRPISYGILKPGEYFEDGVPMLRIIDIKNGKIDFSNVHKVSQSLSQEYKRTLL